MNGTKQNGFKYVRERLSHLGGDAVTQHLMGWNIDRTLKFDLNTPAMLKTLRSGTDGGLQKRVKVFSLLSMAGAVAAEEASDDVDALVTPEQWRQILKEGFGLNDKLLDMVNDSEKYEEAVVEHLQQLSAKLATELAELTGGALTKEQILEVYENLLEELKKTQDTAHDLEDSVVDKFVDVMPDVGADSCH